MKKIILSKLEEFLGIDFRSLAVFRVFLGLLLLCDLATRACDLEAFYTDFGVLPRSVLLEKFADEWIFSIHFISGTLLVQSLLFLAHGLFAVMLLIGFRTRLAVFLCWLMTVSLQARNPAILHGGDVYFRLLLFWSIFLPLGARYSVDRALNPPAGKLPQRFFSLGSAAILLQVGMVYFFSALYKNDPSWKSTGNAVYLALSINQFATPLAVFLRQFPGILKYLALFVYWLEYAGPFLFFIPFWTAPFRVLMVLAFILLHIGFWLCMGLGIFPWVCICGVVLFLPSWFWGKLSLMLATREIAKLKAYYTPKLRTKVKRRVLKFFKAPYLIALKPLTIKPSRLSWVLPGVFLVYVFLWNAGPFCPKLNLPKTLKPVGVFLGLDQKWNMFSPNPMRDDGWYVIPGILADKTEVDLFRDGQPVTWEKPELGSRLYKNDRWRKYMMNLWLADYNAYRIYYGKYMCRKWNRDAKPGRQLMEFEIFFMLEQTVLPGQSTKIVKTSTWQHKCF